MSSRKRTTAALAAIGAGAATVEALRRIDRRRIERDPEWALLRDRPRGRIEQVTAPDGTRLHVEVFGDPDAPPIVLSHGWLCAIRFWVRQLRELPGEFRVIAYDKRGHGRSDRAAGGDYSLPAMADDLRAVLRHTLADGERAVVAGHSFGAMTAVAYADRHRAEGLEHLAAVALLNTGMGDLIDESLVLRLPGPAKAARKTAGRVLLGAAAPLPAIPNPVSMRVVGAVALGPAATPAQVAFCERVVLRCGPQARAGVGRELSRLELHGAIEHLDVPALVIAGRRDLLTPLRLARRLEEALPRSLGLLELDTGHMSPIEAAGEVTDALRDLARAHLRPPARVASA